MLNVQFRRLRTGTGRVIHDQRISRHVSPPWRDSDKDCRVVTGQKQERGWMTGSETREEGMKDSVTGETRGRLSLWTLWRTTHVHRLRQLPRATERSVKNKVSHTGPRRHCTPELQLHYRRS